MLCMIPRMMKIRSLFCEQKAMSDRSFVSCISNFPRKVEQADGQKSELVVDRDFGVLLTADPEEQQDGFHVMKWILTPCTT